MSKPLTLSHSSPELRAPASNGLPHVASATEVSKSARVAVKALDLSGLTSPRSSRSSTPPLQKRALAKTQSQVDVRTAPRQAFQRALSQPDLKRIKTRNNLATDDTELRPAIDRMLAASEKKGGLRHIPCASLRFIEGIVDVAVIKPLGILIAAVVGALFLALAILTFIFSGFGWNKKGGAIAAGFKHVAIDHLKTTLLGIGWILFTVFTGIPRYIAERACAEKYKLFTRSIFRPIERRFLQADKKSMGHLTARTNITKQIVEGVRTSRYRRVLGLLAGTTAFVNASRLNGRLSSSPVATPPKEKYVTPSKAAPEKAEVAPIELDLMASQDLEIVYLDRDAGMV